MTGTEALPPEGFMTLGDALDRAESSWRPRNPGSQSSSVEPGAEPIEGGANRFAGGTTWVDVEYDRPRLETWNRVREALAEGKLLSWIIRSSGALERVPREVWRLKKNAEADLNGEVSYTAGTEALSGDALIN